MIFKYNVGDDVVPYRSVMAERSSALDSSSGVVTNVGSNPGLRMGRV